jgi:hypothetical protein
MDALTTEAGDEKALPVFGFEEDARLFVLCEDLGEGWRIRETPTEEVVSMLFGPHARAGRVVLDPLPKIAGGEMNALLSMDRDAFLLFLAGERGGPNATPSAPRPEV